MEQVDREIIKGLQAGDQQAYSILIRLYFQSLTIYAKSILSNFDQAKDIVQELFINIWNNREAIEINTSLKPYIYRSVHNACIDYLRKEKAENTIRTISYDDLQIKLQIFDIKDDENLFDILFSEELEIQLQNAIDELPTQCKEIFILSRYDHLSYKEISEKLSISLSTVKTQMVRAMQKLAKSLKTYLK